MSWAVGVFVGLLAVGVPIGLVMVASGLVGAVSIGGLNYLEIVADRFYSGVSGFVLIAVPYFVFTAEIMNRSGLTERMVAFANSLFGKLPARSATSISWLASFSQASPVPPLPTRLPSVRP